MKKLSFVYLSVLFVILFVSPLCAIEYAADFLEAANPGGLGTCDISATPCSSDADCAGGVLSCLNHSLKTFDDEWAMAENEEVYMDIWLKDCPESMITAGFGIAYDPLEVTILGIDAYDGVNLSGPWDDQFTNSFEIEPGWWFLLLGQLSCVEPDRDGDMILGRVRLHAETTGNPSIGIFPLGNSFDTVVGCSGEAVTYDPQIPVKAINQYTTFCYLNVTPQEPTVHPGGSIQFTANEIGPCNDSCYFWEIIEVGSVGSIIDSNGLYTAGTSTGTDLVTVTDPCNGDISDSATISIDSSVSTTTTTIYSPPHQCYVRLHHEAPFIHTGETLQFSATPSYDCDNTPCYNWEIAEGGIDGSAIDANGLYTAGDTAGMDLVAVTDLCNGNSSNSITVSVGPPPTSIYKFNRMWPTLRQPWYFQQVWDTAVDSNGFVYVPDNIRGYIQKFTSDGQFVTKWGSWCDMRDGSGCEDPDGDGPLELGDGQFSLALVSIAVDNNAFVYVADYGLFNDHSLYPRIQKFTPDGQFVTKWGNSGGVDGEYFSANDIVVDDNGFFYVFDHSPGRILKFTPEWQLVTQWGSHCDLYNGIGCEDPDGDGPLELGDGQFNGSGTIAVDNSGYVYVADKNQRIQKFTADGQFVTKWGDGQFGGSMTIAVDNSGHVYVGEHFNSRIQQFTSDGQFVAKWGSSCILLNGSGCEDPDGDGPLELGDGQFGYINDIAVSDNGFVYVVEEFNPRIQKFTVDGQFVDKWQSFGYGEGEFNTLYDIAIDMNGFVYVDDGGRVQKFTPEGQFVEELETYGQLKAIDGNHFFYYIDNNVEDDLITKVSADGETVARWGTIGTGDGEFEEISDIAIDSSGYVYVADSDSGDFPPDHPSWPYNQHQRIQKFTADGQFVTQWGSYCHLYNGGGCEDPDGDGPLEPGDGQFRNPRSIAVDMNGYVYVSDWNDRIQKFTPGGQFVDKWSARCEDLAIDSDGFLYCTYTDNVVPSLPAIYIPISVLKFTLEGQFVGKWGGSFGSDPGEIALIGGIAVGLNDRIYITDVMNHRVQVFKETSNFSNPKAIIVAGRASSEDSLWDVTQMCTNFAYRTLTYQGFTGDDIQYLSADTDLDLDNDGEPDVDADASIASLDEAITGWAVLEGAESLVLYLNDHGGEDTFRINENETLSAADLDSWLDELQESITGTITVVYEACESGSFVDELEDDDRIIITSTLPGEQAKFLNHGTISFSYFFWSNIFNGLTIDESFTGASQAVSFTFSDQTPQLNGDVGNLSIGNGIKGMLGEAPEIGAVSPPQEIHHENSALLYADNVTDPDGIARVWAVILPPDYDPGPADNPLLDLPSVDLFITHEEGENRYEGTYNEFNAVGTYQISLYAMDRNGNISLPEFTTVSKNVSRRAIIVAGGADQNINRQMIEYNAELAYNTLISQHYDEEAIYFMSLTTFLEDVITYLPSLTNFENSLETLADDTSITNLDLTIYLIGASEDRNFVLNDDPDEYEALSASQLDEWLDDLQAVKPGRVTVICDFDQSGTFIRHHTFPEGTQRVTITSTGEETAAYYNSQGNISFSSFLWDQLAAGATIGDAFIYARKAIAYCALPNDVSFSCYNPQIPLLDANSNRIPNETADYDLVEDLKIGDGIVSANDPPQIGSVSVVREGEMITITAEDISSTAPIERVWAIINPLLYCPGSSEGSPQVATEVVLEGPDEEGRYVNTYPADYACRVTVYAMSYDTEGEPNISTPKVTRIYQEGGDIYEPDNLPSEANVIVVNYPTAQPHTFHHPDDEDWVKFYGLKMDENYYIEVSNLGNNCPVIEIYDGDDLTTLIDQTREPPTDDGKVWLDFRCEKDGVYYMRLVWGGCEWVEDKMHYDLQIYDNNWGLTAIVRGKVRDRVSGRGIDGAVIRSSGVGATVSTHGEYILSEIPGSWTLRARKSGYTTATKGIRIDSHDQQIRKDIRMTPRSNPCSEDTDCDDGNYCNGIEICVDETCQLGTDPCQDDGLYCNGEEVGCDEEDDICEHSGSPCPGHQACVEENDECVDKVCDTSDQCDDRQFCNGIETCVEGLCQEGIYPCAEPTPACDEEEDICIEGPKIQLLPNPCLQSRWIPLPMFLRILGTNTHFDTSSLVTFNPPGTLMALPILGDAEHLFMIGLLMPEWWITTESIEVAVTTGTEKVSETLHLNPLPFMLTE